jgi:peptide/nickel transport system permease protein
MSVATPAMADGDARRRAFADGWRRFSRNRLSVAGLAIVVVFVAAGACAPWVAPYDPFGLIGARLAAPSPANLFGTDHLGRDVFSGVIYGARTSLAVGFISVGLSVSIGLTAGLIAGYYGGFVDDLLMRLTELFQVLPRFFMALVIVAIFGANLWGTILVIGLLSWPEIARLVRSEVLTLRGRPFVTAARAYGAGDGRIIFGEILPNALTAVVVASCLQIPSAILLEASLSFIGAGDPNVMSWGRMLNNAQQYMRQAWWTAAFPGAAISLMAMGVALMADGVNDLLDPRLRGRAA